MQLPEPGEQPLVRCGAIGTNLYGPGTAGGPVEALNTRDPERVLTLYQAYVAAGARALVTNTYAANSLCLSEHELTGECAVINRAGVQIARDAAGVDCAVWGCVGPLSLGFRADDYPAEDLVRIYSEQCEYLSAADALVLETFVDLREARAALQAARATGLPVILQVGRLTAGAARHERLRRLVEEAEACGAVALGANCQHPAETQRTLRELA
ncbi:MAG TPA: homocysteine S-methyltransferase family protein, partial [Armatimonadota bacterium]|nr:homocysteine S-methyltransferase family protein [Armatimonadota bacterium]